jgi:hypothetical protein
MERPAEYFQERLRRREVERRLTSELQMATEKARLAGNDPDQSRRAWDDQLVALERFRKFVAHGIIPSDLERSPTSGA